MTSTILVIKIVVVILGTLMIGRGGFAVDVTMKMFTKLASGSGVADSVHALSTVASPSVIHCSMVCRRDGCVMFTYDVAVTQCSTFSSSDLVAGSYAGTSIKLYIVPPNWPLNEACTADAECAAMLDKTVCFKGKCLCTPGLYYSVSTRKCITTCAAADLQTSYQRYRLAAIAGDYVGFHAGQASPETCMEAKCTTTAGCLGFNWHTGNGYCALVGVTGSSPSWSPNYPDLYDFFQRNCA